jgi:hypothetical protein
VDPIWTALALVLSGAGGYWTVHAFRTRGVASGLRGAGLTLLPLAALMTDTLKLLVNLGVDIGDWAVGLVFSPLVWLGIILAGTAVVLFGAGTLLQRRALPAAPERKALPKGGGNASKGAPAIDDDLADIEAILKRRGIS